MFTVPTKTRYGLRALICLAADGRAKPLSLASIAEREELSVKYLENIFNSLKKSGIVKSSRGPSGGYQLMRAPEKLTVYEVIEALDGPLVTVDCTVDPAACTRDDCCMQPFWSDLQDTIVAYFKARTLASLMCGPKKKKK